MTETTRTTDEKWFKRVPLLKHFAQVADPGSYAPVPSDWHIGISDTVDSAAAIEAGRYKAVNMAGAATISAVANALEGDLPIFSFGGDGAFFIVPPRQQTTAQDALLRVAAWVHRDLDLELRVGMTTVGAVRDAGFDLRVAFWSASRNVRYPMFTGGGMEWTEAQLRAGAIDLEPDVDRQDPDLTGLSCQWGPIQPRHGKIVSLIIKKEPSAEDADFSEMLSRLLAEFEQTVSSNPMPATGPDVRWPSGALALQSRIAQSGIPKWRRMLSVVVKAAVAWTVFKFGLRVAGFRPDIYRREISENTDFRKFADALMLTVDCSPETVTRLQTTLDEAKARGIIRYGLHVQDEALLTCVAPSVLTSDHMHFIDGAGGGYTLAARQLGK